MTQPSSVRFVMEDRFNADLDAYKAEVDADQAAFEAQIDSDYANNLYTVPKTNYVVNGAFDIWQRGTSFAAKPSGSFFADRWFHSYDGTPSGLTISRDTIPRTSLMGHNNASYVMKYETTGATTGGTYNNIVTRIENVETALSGSLKLLSMGVYDDSTMYIDIDIVQNFGSGGSTSVTTNVASSLSINKYNSASPRMIQASINYTLPSIVGKTIGAGSYLEIIFKLPVPSASATNPTMQFWLGKVSLTNMTNDTSQIYSRVGGSIAGELVACQRYYYRTTPTTTGSRYGVGGSVSTTSGNFYINFPTTMRTRPTALEQSGTAAHYAITNAAGATVACSAVPVFQGSTEYGASITAASTYTAGGQAAFILSNNIAGYLGFSAEL